MRTDNIALEEKRFEGIISIDQYPSFHERHRIFPAVFADRNHKRILDIAAGMGVAAGRIRENYPAELICNDVCPTCLKVLKEQGLNTVSFDIDSCDEKFPFPDEHFDAIIALATIEHVINIEHFLKEIRRMLTAGGYLYLSAPNYSGLTYLLPFLKTGKTFHDPLDEVESYEFYAHVRYFTYRSLMELTADYGFTPEAVYLGIPKQSARYQSLKQRSKLKAFAFQQIMRTLYTFFSPRWAAEPVICFKKTDNNMEKEEKFRPRKVVM